MYQETTPIHGYYFDSSDENNLAVSSDAQQVKVSGPYLIQDFRDANSDGPSHLFHQPTDPGSTTSTNGNTLIVCANNSPIVVYLKKDWYVKASSGAVGMMLLKKVVSP